MVLVLGTLDIGVVILGLYRDYMGLMENATRMGYIGVSIVGAQQGTISLRTPSMCNYACGCSSKQLSSHIKLGIATLELRLR